MRRIICLTYQRQIPSNNKLFTINIRHFGIVGVDARCRILSSKRAVPTERIGYWINTFCKKQQLAPTVINPHIVNANNGFSAENGVKIVVGVTIWGENLRGKKEIVAANSELRRRRF